MPLLSIITCFFTVARNDVGALTMPPLSALFVNNDDPYFSDKLSSPQRYAAALNLSIEEVAQIQRAHEDAMENLHQRLASDEIPGQEKHTLLCQHRLKHGRHPFVCDRCWSYLPICVCSIAGKDRLPLPANLSVIVWTHHREWGLTSNTGGLLGLMLNNCHILMKGLPEHEEILNMHLQDPKTMVVVLWPDQKSPVNNQTSRYISLSHVQSCLSHHKVVLVAIDGTWRNARRMVARLPLDRIWYTDLSVDALKEVLNDSVPSKTRPAGTFGQSKSLLAPLRGRGPDAAENQVCTAEAVAGALLQLGLPQDHGNRILSVARRKVDLVCRYRAKVIG
jgi:DTW domain-containing protein YfiP